LLEGNPAVVFFLVENIPFDFFYVGWTDCYATITRLPTKASLSYFRVNPFRGSTFYLSQNDSDSVGCAQTHEHVNVILDTSYCQGNSIEILEDTAKVSVKLFAPFTGY
jgi:hypothetical protein